MGLLSIDITKVKRLSLREVSLPAPEQKAEPITLTLVEKPPTEEEIAYSRIVASNPAIELFVDRLDLVSETTGERLRKVDPRAEHSPSPKPEPKDTDSPRLVALAQEILQKYNSYTMEEVTERIREATNVSQDRAERGFSLMLQAGAIEPTLGGRYYLTGSTPF